jgi:hypothetical protein
VARKVSSASVLSALTYEFVNDLNISFKVGACGPKTLKKVGNQSLKDGKRE